MKFNFCFSIALLFVSTLSMAQTLYVPSGTSGIGSSTNSNVGIGTTSTPSEKLEINGSVRGNQSGALRISTGSGYVDIGPKNTAYSHFTTDRPLFYFDKEVRVNPGAIGSYSGSFLIKTAGTTQLTIETNGNATFSGNVYAPFMKWIGFGVPTEGNYRLVMVHNGVHGYIDYKDNLHFRANNNWTSALTLYGNGSVGIGFTTTYNAGEYKNQNYKLAVNGGILCEEIEVIQDVPDADYVFESNYQLMPLSLVEAFIRENGHLPNIPSAQEFKTNGYKVGEMDEMLLRKMEEMTLYVIELNKKVELLQQENLLLQKKIETMTEAK